MKNVYHEKEDYSLRIKKWTVQEKDLVANLREKGYGPKKIADTTGFPINQVRFWLYGSRSKTIKTKLRDRNAHREHARRSYYRMKYNDWESWKAQTICSSIRAKAKKLGIKPMPIAEVRSWLYRVDMVCRYCGVKLDQENFGVDHGQPLSRGGQNTVDNLVECCKACNMSKGAMTVKEYKDLLELINSWEDSGASLLSKLRYSGVMYLRKK